MEETKEEENSFEVVVRCQPLIQRSFYQQRGITQEQALFVDQLQSTIRVQFQNEQQEKEEKLFPFKKIISSNQSQMEVYQLVVSPLVESTFYGFNSTIIVYGQTGSGKTYTMEGENDNKQLENRGFIYRAVDQIFDSIEKNSQIQYILRVSILTVYNEYVDDMLQSQNVKLKIRQSREMGFYAQDLTELVIVNKQQMLRFIQEAELMNKIRITQMGRVSSRSYKIVQFKIQNFDHAKEELKIGTLSLVTMAGSEITARNSSKYQYVLKQSTPIYSGIKTFKEIITRLTSPKKQVIPYRESQVTKLLSNSIGGNTKTVLLTTVASDQVNSEETLQTLQLALRATGVKNKAKINLITDSSIIQKFKEDYQNICSNRQICFKTSLSIK